MLLALTIWQIFSIGNYFEPLHHDKCCYKQEVEYE